MINGGNRMDIKYNSKSDSAGGTSENEKKGVDVYK
jgi:hypothetical protein